MRASAIAGISVLVVVLALVGVAPARAQQRGEDDSAELVDEGRRALRARKYGDAAEALDQALALNPRRIEAYVLRAAVHAARGEYARGVRLLRKARALAPDNLDVLSALGNQLVLDGDADAGVAVLEPEANRRCSQDGERLDLIHQEVEEVSLGRRHTPVPCEHPVRTVEHVRQLEHDDGHDQAPVAGPCHEEHCRDQGHEEGR